MRPILPDDGVTSEGKVISYPTSIEALGQGIDVAQNGTFFGGEILDYLFVFFFLCIILIT